MRPLPRFQLHSPVTLRGALELLDELEDAKPLAGGTDLLVAMREGEQAPGHLVDLGWIPELSYVEEGEGYVRIGATATLAQIASSPAAAKLPALLDALRVMGSPQIRNRGTLAGNLVNASPAADTACPLLVHGGEVVAASVEGSRVIPLEEFFTGPKKCCLEANELVVEVRAPIPPEGSSSAYVRLGRRKGFTLSVVGAAVYLEVEDGVCVEASAAYGSVAPTPLKLEEVGEALEGGPLTPERVEAAAALSAQLVNPITDIRGTAEYRRDMCPVLTRRAVEKALGRLGV